jgi:1-acyl-sn-glycerol-3-phosphate acyltransferase
MAGSLALAVRAMVETLAISAPTVVEAMTGRLSREVCDTRLDRWARRLLEQADVGLDVHGRERIPVDETFVVMSNHRSHYDIPVLFAAFPARLRMVAKSELFRVPIWGRAMRVAGFIELDRNNRERAIESLKAARIALDSGVNVWIAPEGTRSRTGELGAFKRGGFMLALDTARRILPVAIDGTQQILPAEGARVQRGARVSVRFGEPIDAASFGNERRDALVEHVRTAIAGML